ncbi:flagellar motor switch protein FliN [Vibrio sp. S17_S38]|uniref:FliM/FliN family flagellar motor switch protein n=1 Tax=Vibrio sp. S17_S38 TaxID=2720229 RepID=UPI0016819F3F|nr:FliM/FliN family flagellar motor switch protein [Vibrio sp. S17_S38]MBD1573442.1 flagellar motor switch protein FliN [Vibrio sp. S17_S38]
MDTEIENKELDSDLNLDSLNSDFIEESDLMSDFDLETGDIQLDNSPLDEDNFDPDMLEQHLTSRDSTTSLGLLSTIPVTMTVEISQKQLPIEDLMNFEQGQIITLDKSLGEPVDLRVNGVLFATGQIVESDGKYGVKVLSLATNNL